MLFRTLVCHSGDTRRRYFFIAITYDGTVPHTKGLVLEATIATEL